MTRLALLALVPWLLHGVQVPAGARLEVRLDKAVSSAHSRKKDPVTAVLVTPVVVNGEVRIAAGARLSGQITEASPAPSPEARASLAIDFRSLSASGLRKPVPVSLRLLDVDNAREQVDEKGHIQGILKSETITARMDRGLEKLGERYKGLAGVLGSVKNSLVKDADPEIEYPAGTDLTLEVLKPFSWSGPPAVPLDSFREPEGLASLVLRQPWQTEALKPRRPSDLTNLMFIGSREQIESAFEAAGWTPAAALNGRSSWETVRAVIELRGYREAPVSILTLDGNPPDLVFQKQNNTFAQRHHLRIYARPETYDGLPVWVCSATHDIAIDFSTEDRMFIHRIDPEIDRERAKVTSDLLFTGQVRSLALVPRPDVPREGRNATGDALHTDGAMAVLEFASVRATLSSK